MNLMTTNTPGYERALEGMKSYAGSIAESVSDAVSDLPDTQVARCLGWASIGIGLAEIAMPGKVEQLLGVGDGQNTGVLRALGVREIGHGIDILSHPDPTPGVWGRVAGDVLDGVLMAMAGRRTRNPSGFATAAVMVLGIAALDLLCAKRLSAKPRYARRYDYE
jgi:hypothetical protein